MLKEINTHACTWTHMLVCACAQKNKIHKNECTHGVFEGVEHSFIVSLDHVIWWLGLCGLEVLESEAYTHASRERTEQTPAFSSLCLPLTCQLKSLLPLSFQAWPRECLENSVYKCSVILVYRLAGLEMRNFLTTRDPMIALCFE